MTNEKHTVLQNRLEMEILQDVLDKVELKWSDEGIENLFPSFDANHDTRVEVECIISSYANGEICLETPLVYPLYEEIRNFLRAYLSLVS